MIDLRKIIIEYPSSLKDMKSLFEILNKCYPNENDQIRKIILAYEWGVIVKIQRLTNPTIESIEILAISLAETRGLEVSEAIGVILQWMNAFGLELENNTGYSDDMIVEGDPKAFIVSNVDEDSVEIKEFCGFDEEYIVIPNLIGGKKVIGIGKGAYKNLKKVKKIQITEGINYLGASVFSGCSLLTEIELPQSLEQIGVEGENEESEIVENTNNQIDDEQNCIYVLGRKISLCDYDEEDYKNINKGVFKGTLIEHIILPNRVKQIGKGAFANMIQLSSIKLPDELFEIPDYCFFNCEKLESVIIPKEVSILGVQAFKRCRNLQSINIPPNATMIDEQVFMKCTKLRRVIFEGKITNICKEAFKFSGIEEIELPGTIKYMEESIFAYCDALRQVRIRRGIQYIPEKCFYECFNLENIDLPITIMTIGKKAFEGCKELKKVTVPSSVQVIREAAFRNSGLEELTLKEGLFTIEQDSFANCSLSGDIVLPKTLTNIACNCFNGNYGINFLCYIGSEGLMFAKKNEFDYANAENR